MTSQIIAQELEYLQNMGFIERWQTSFVDEVEIFLVNGVLEISSLNNKWKNITTGKSGEYISLLNFVSGYFNKNNRGSF